MMKALCVLVLLFVCGGVARVFDPRDIGWEHLSLYDSAAAAEYTTMPITVLLKQQNLGLLRDIVYNVSTPSSLYYGRYLSREDITTLVAPPESSVEAVMAWLRRVGASDVRIVNNRDVIRARLQPRKVESFFGVRLSAFNRNGVTVLRAAPPQSVHIPAHLQPHVSMVLGIADFPPVMTRHSHSRPAPSQQANSNAPTIIEVRGDDYSITVEFYPACKSSGTTTSVPPCQDIPPAVSSVILSAYDYYRNYSTTVTPTCSVNSDAEVECTASVFASEYEPLMVSIQEVFADGSKGDVAYNNWAVVNAPPVTPYVVDQHYSLPPNRLVTHPDATQAVVEFEQQWYSPDDLVTFLKTYGRPADTTVLLVGDNYPDIPGVEAQLDIQWLMGVAPGAVTTFWSMPANSSTEIDDILAWAIEMNDDPNPPIVNSMSYGMSAVNVDVYLGDGYLDRSETELQKLAARGISVLVATGDTGAGDLGGPPMGVDFCEPLSYDWPSCCEYITAVGATFFTPYSQKQCYTSPDAGGFDCLNNAVGEAGVSVDIGIFWTSGGGFANESRPDFQDDQVSAYLASTDITFPPSNYWNRDGRAYPDVSAVGHNMQVVHEGSWISVDGTSASAPVFSGVVTLINDQLLTLGRPQLGFLNPLLYEVYAKHPEAFYDVTAGSNRCGAVDTVPVCCDYGYQATTGWDAVAGLGTPVFDKLVEAIIDVIDNSKK